MIDGKIVKEKIRKEKMMNNCSEDLLDRLTDSVINSCIPEMEQNLMEWAMDKPFTDVVIGNGWTVNKLLEIYPWINMMDILIAMKAYKNCNYENEAFDIMFYQK